MTKENVLRSSKITLGLIAGAAVALMSLAGTASAARPTMPNPAKPGTQTIVEIVTAPDGEFDVLQAAVVRAGLVGALNGSTQYTVFAPTDEAFMNLLGASTEAEAISVINGLEDAVLTDTLLFHVTEGRRTSTSVLAAPRYQMLNGDKLTRTQLKNAGIVGANISARNGVIHVIGSVLTPPAN
jgi:uncharacterized surface protein with fasciclin (FAS1) repeats